MRRFGFLAALIIGFSVIVAPSAYAKAGASLAVIMIESDIPGVTEIKGVTGITVTMNEAYAWWNFGEETIVYPDAGDFELGAVVLPGHDWTTSDWANGEISWTGTSPLLVGGNLSMLESPVDADDPGITNVVVEGLEGTYTWEVTKPTHQPWELWNYWYYFLTITLTPDCPFECVPPAITLIGDDYVELNIGDTYTDAGATALDNVDGDITASIVVVNPVPADITESWSYTVTYTVTDAAGNVGRASRTVIVLPGDDDRDYDDVTASDIERLAQDAGCFVNSVSADTEQNSHSMMTVLLTGLLLVCVIGYFMEKRFMKMLLVLLVGVGLLLGGSPAVNAQETEAEATQEGDKDVFTLEEMVVTATKREASIMDVPLAVTGFGDKKIEELGMTSKEDLENLVPGLQYGESTEFSGHGIVIRGIGSLGSATSHADLAVAVYVDGIYNHSQSGVAPNLFDVERVEVGRGPQGTLHGRNSIGGSISFHTKKPTMDWDAEALVEITDQVTERFNVALGGPIIGGFSFRITGGRFTGDGSQKNVGYGGDYGVPDETTISPQLRFKNDRFDITLSHSFTKDEGVPETNLMLWQPRRDVPFVCAWTGQAADLTSDPFVNVRPGDLDEDGKGFIDGQEFICTGTVASPNTTWFLAEGRVPAVEDCPPGLLANDCNDLKNMVSLNRPGGKDMIRESWTFNADTKITEWLTLRYTYGESQLNEENFSDGDGTNRIPIDQTAKIRLATDGGVPFSDSRGYNTFQVDGASHEVQLISYLDGPFNFILGYYTYENYTYYEGAGIGFASDAYGVNSNERAQALGFSSCEDAFPSDPSNGHPGWNDATIHPTRCSPPGFDKGWVWSSDAYSETKAVFGSVDYAFNDQWLLSAGLRWTEDARWKLQDNIWDEQAMWDLAGTDDDTTDDIVIIWRQVGKDDIDMSETRPSWDAWIWNLSLEYRPVEGTMVYGRISTGYRAGGFNTGYGYNPPIEEETLINYELGLKGLYLDNRLNIRATGFYEDYNDYQLTAWQLRHDAVNDGTSLIQDPVVEYTDNVDGTYIYGLELESSYWINDSLSVSAMYAFTDSHLGTHGARLDNDTEAEYVEWHYQDASGDPQVNVIQYPREFSGGRLPMQPKHKAAVTVIYETPLDLLKGTVQLLGTWSYTGERYPYAQNVESQVMAGYDRLDLRAGWTSYDQHWSVVLYVQNALDDVGLSEYLPVGTEATGALTDPRQFGITLRWKW